MIELTGRDKSFWVLGATSRPWQLAETIRKRFQLQAYVPLPNTEEKANLLKTLIEKKYAHMVTMDQLNQLAENMEMFTADEVQKVVSLAAGYAIDAMDEASHFTQVNYKKQDNTNSERKYWVACTPKHKRAEKLTMQECPGQCLPLITINYLKKAKKEIKPLTTETVLNSFEDHKEGKPVKSV